MPDYGKVAYEAYAEHQGWKSYSGLPLPPWPGVREDIKEAWSAAAQAILEFRNQSLGQYSKGAARSAAEVTESGTPGSSR